MNQNFIIVCESAIIEKDTNNLYILGIFENLNTDKIPVTKPKFAVVTSFDGGEEGREYQHKIIIRDESGDETVVLNGKINFGRNQKAQYIGNFIGVSFQNFGKYTIEVYVDEKLQPLNTSINVNRL